MTVADDLRAGSAGPRNKREARRWIRAYWSDLINAADMGGVGDMENDAIDAVWGDECEKIAKRIDRAIANEEHHDRA